MTQEVGVNIINTLEKTGVVSVTLDTNLIESSDELIAAYNDLRAKNEELKNNCQNDKSKNQAQVDSLKSENEHLKDQVQNMSAHGPNLN